MTERNSIACVTGASGMIGSPIVRGLVSAGYRVRVLTRKLNSYYNGVDVFQGDLLSEDDLKGFIKNASLVFHCAAELTNESRMWDVNVSGTERLLKAVKNENIQYFCYLSSAGVVGKTQKKWNDENAECNPQNAYEQSKWAAEQLVAKGIDVCRVVILRPTNVIDEERPGELSLIIHRSVPNRLKAFLKGGEYTHIVHADDVAAVALYFIDHPIENPRCFFVSYDDEPLTTLAGLAALFKSYAEGNFAASGVKPALHMPIVVPYLLRRLWRGKGNRGDIRYSPEQLKSTGFVFPLGFEGAVKKIFSRFRYEPL